MLVTLSTQRPLVFKQKNFTIGRPRPANFKRTAAQTEDHLRQTANLTGMAVCLAGRFDSYGRGQKKFWPAPNLSMRNSTQNEYFIYLFSLRSLSVLKLKREEFLKI